MNTKDIFFKAKRVDNGEWVEGYFAQKKDTTYCFSNENEDVKTRSYIIVDTMTDWSLPNEFNYFEVDPKTVCRYICKDEYGERIYDNDVIEHKFNFFKINYNTALHCNTITKLHNTNEIITGQYHEEDCIIDYHHPIYSKSVVIGNIFDDDIINMIKESEKIMKEIIKYECEICGTVFSNKERCEACEKSHKHPIGISNYEFYKGEHTYYPDNITIQFDDGNEYIYYLDDDDRN